MPTDNGSPAVTTTERGADGKAEREYVVLMEVASALGERPDDLHYAIVGRPAAINDTEARKAVNRTLPEDERDAPLVAVPARYWKPKARKVHQPPPVESWD